MITKLTFFWDKSGKKPISKLENGKVVIQHRDDTATIVPGLEYIVEVDKELDNVAFCRIIDLALYPRFILRRDGICLVVLAQGNKVKHLLAPDIDHAVKQYLEPDKWGLVLWRR